MVPAPVSVLGKADGNFRRGLFALGAGEDSTFAVSGLNGKARKWTLDGCEDGTVAREVESYDAHLLAVSKIAIKRNCMATVSLEGDLKFWVGAKKEPEVHIKDYDLNAVAFLSDAERAVVVGGRGMYGLAETHQKGIDDHTFVKAPSGAGDGERRFPPVFAVVDVDSQDGKSAAGATDGTLAVFDVGSSKELLVNRKTHTDRVRGLRICPNDPNVFVSTGDDRRTSFFDIRAGTAVDAYPLQKHESMCADISADGNCVVTGGADAAVRVWDRRKGEVVYKSTVHSGIIWGVSFMAEGNRLVSISDDEKIFVYDTTNLCITA